QNIGIGSGAVIGAVAGGPLGAIIGAAVGGHYADTAQRSAKVPGLQGELGTARNELGDAQNRVARLNRSLFETRNELQKLGEEMSGLLLERAAFEGLQMEVLYQTGDSMLTESAATRVNRLAELLQKLPDLTIRLDGYADPRGDETFNDGLSRERAESVRAALISAGVSADRISLHAHGESTSVSADGDLDGYAFERKVRVRLFGSSKDTKVAQQD
ncbi:MAG: OmpA family protein, partial [Gammaproteobacteria bacterium]|nr:OmpA family protein [Gammaproteobacteria bacterium]